jgi:hypothetical protein
MIDNYFLMAIREEGGAGFVVPVILEKMSSSLSREFT